MFMKSAGLSKVPSNTYHQLIKGEQGTGEPVLESGLSCLHSSPTHHKDAHH